MSYILATVSDVCKADGHLLNLHMYIESSASLYPPIRFSIFLSHSLLTPTSIWSHLWDRLISISLSLSLSVFFFLFFFIFVSLKCSGIVLCRGSLRLGMQFWMFAIG